MSGSNSIEWTETTWNPVTGCDRCSDGCNNCYALTLAGRLKLMGSAKYQNDGAPTTSGPGFAVTLHPDELDTVHRWRDPRTVFVCSMSDLFHPDVPADFIADVFAVMGTHPLHTFQVLTKRSSRMRGILSSKDWWSIVADKMVRRSASWVGDPVGALSFMQLRNVWLGVSVESNQWAFRADHLRDTPAAVRWVSAEPLLGPLDALDLTGIDWLVVGGESGPSPSTVRPMNPEWVRTLRDRATEGVACGCDDPSWCALCLGSGRRTTRFFFKQFGRWAPAAPGEQLTDQQLRRAIVFDDDRIVPASNQPADLGGETLVLQRTKGLRVLDGRTWDEMPGRAR